MKIPHPTTMMSFGLWFMIQGAAGYERYMMQGNIPAAIFDAALQIVGLGLFWFGARLAWTVVFIAARDAGKGE